VPRQEEVLLKKLLTSGSPEDIEKACLLMKECMAFRWLPEKDNRGRELVTAIDDYWLKLIIDKYAKEVGAKAGLPAIRIFEEGLRTISSDPRRGYGSALWRPAIETNEQNTNFRGPENRFVEGMRDSLAGWVEANPADAVPFDFMTSLAAVWVILLTKMVGFSGEMVRVRGRKRR
jgi:hypothetical protein